ncbi:FAD-binding oxidoreductase [Oceanibium sediminis]|uniref:FAD-binding oxidoreductase n=1 Tax=Oceanibium sediminis TaxID=2026339 RepID=UPI000DD34104|nr:FAD-binding oxidoreductase [Oceanibium sediminis]
MTLTSATPDHVAALAACLPDGTVGPVPESYRTEPRARWEGASAALLKPRTTDEVARIVRFAAEHRIGLVPYAGGTGLVGGQIAPGPATLLVSVERMTAPAEVDPLDNTATVGAGTILSDIHAMTEVQDRLFPLSLASQGSARIGGLLATNAGGVAVLRYGNARDLCLGVEAVLPDGSILHGLKRLRKDNTGYDLRNLLIGSEGSLGIITAAVLRLFPRPRETGTAMVVTESPDTALRLLAHMRDALGEALSAFELIHGQGLAFLDEVLPDTPQPFSPRPEWAVLIEAGAGAGAELTARLEASLVEAFEAGLIADAVIAQNKAQAQAFWAVRETIPEANRLIGSVASHDISVPVSAIPEFIARGGPALRSIDPRFRINCFGHLGDGNLHYNVFPPQGGRRKDHESQRAEVSGTVHALAAELGGSISAEHGIGRLKVADLERFGDPAKLAAMRAVKSALDPLGIMNPGAVLRA